jgi:PAS domain S-box-containing protein
MNRMIAESAVVLAPRGRDAAIARAMLAEAGIDSQVTPDFAGFVEAVRGGAGFALVTEEALRGADLRPLARFIESQDEWSDFPFVLLTERGGGTERNPDAARLLAALGNVTFLERPFHPTTLISLARAALRARRRQYEARSRLEAIREGEARLRIALAAGGLGAWLFDVETQALETSADCKAHYGRGPDEPFDYVELLASIHPEDLPAMQAATQQTLMTGEDYDVAYRCIWPDGSLHWVQAHGRVNRDAAGQPIRVVGVTQDITGRKQDEEALRRFALELEQRVEERTREREVAVAQLHEAQKLETLGQLTGGVAHDFNNLLTPVIGNLDLLRRRHEDERSQRLISGALQASERARTLVSRLLAFARRQNLEARPIDPRVLVGGMLDLLRRSLGPLIEIALDMPNDLPAAMVDPNQLELALLNLAVNARDAMPEGGTLSITLAAEAVPPENRANVPAGRYVCFAIADTGAGMDEATLRRAVEPFYSTKGVGKGTGLGLSMVHGLAAQSGGALLLTSEVGVGTTAELWLPVADGPVVAALVAAEDPTVEMASLRILLVDDEELVRAGTADMLADMGHAVVQAASGAQALGLLGGGGFDLLVSDYLMPGMTGIELATEARRIAPDLPVLLITGFADMPAGDGGDVSRLPKPFRRRELARALVQLGAAAGDQWMRRTQP